MIVFVAMSNYISMNQQDLSTLTPEQQMRRRAQKITKFLYHVLWYVVINIFLYWLDYRENQVIDWAYWVTIGWGFGIVAQVFTLVAGPNLEEAIYNKISKK
jgi:hypothetical protein